MWTASRFTGRPIIPTLRPHLHWQRHFDEKAERATSDDSATKGQARRHIWQQCCSRKRGAEDEP
eukprot:8403935-Pyramimonas_sp.AAC.1